MTDEDLQGKWQAGKDILEEMGTYLMSPAGIADYGNAVKILDLVEKFEKTKDEYKTLLAERKIFKSTETVNVPDFKSVEGYIEKIKAFAGQVKRSYC